MFIFWRENSNSTKSDFNAAELVKEKEFFLNAL